MPERVAKMAQMAPPLRATADANVRIEMKDERNIRTLDGLDLEELRKIPDISYYFRYPLHRHDFHDLRLHGSLRGRFAAKPLYSRLTDKGRVDRSSGYSGDVATLFVPLGAKSPSDVGLLLAHMAPERIVLPTGRRNWPAILQTAEHGIMEMLERSSR
jgi:hypothetical protein